MVPSLQQLLASIVDYAGLFPPAQLGLLEAMTVYDRACGSADAWMLDRFVLPASRLSEFIGLLTDFAATHSTSNLARRWALSVILSKNWKNELEHIHSISQSEHRIEITAWEIAPLSPIEIQSVCYHLPGSVPRFFELSLDAELEPALEVLQQMGAAAKLRTGGITYVAFPDSIWLSQCILSLAKNQIPFKATAGLHHALYGNYRLTYQPDSHTATMYGFLNLALLAAFVYQQTLSPDAAIALLETTSLDDFQFTETEVRWRDRTLSLEEIQHSRQQFFRSFGSCSFQEPIDDLQNLGLMQRPSTSGIPGSGEQ